MKLPKWLWNKYWHNKWWRYTDNTEARLITKALLTICLVGVILMISGEFLWLSGCILRG